MVEDNTNKLNWWLITFAVIAVLAVSIANPTIAKIRAQQSKIANIDYTAPAVTP